MLLSGFGCGSAYTANLAFMITSILSPAGVSLGIFTEKWLNWISAQHNVSMALWMVFTGLLPQEGL